MCRYGEYYSSLVNFLSRKANSHSAASGLGLPPGRRLAETHTGARSSLQAPILAVVPTKDRCGAQI